MLKHTFIHIPGIGPKLEQRIWAAGIRSWEDVIREGESGTVSLPFRIRRVLFPFIKDSMEHFLRGEAGFFSGLLPSHEQWRILAGFPGKTAFLDIETDGLSPHFDSITLIGLYDGKRYRAFVRGENLDDFPAAFQDFSVVVTFNGAGFDLPFLKNRFGSRVVDVGPRGFAHVDLRFVLKRLGYKGGLKKIETKLGIRRDPSVHGVDGYMAVVLWRKHMRGDTRALPVLLRYNFEDTVNLAELAVISYNLALKQVPVGLSELPLPPKPSMPIHLSDEPLRKIPLGKAGSG